MPVWSEKPLIHQINAYTCERQNSAFAVAQWFSSTPRLLRIHCHSRWNPRAEVTGSSAPHRLRRQTAGHGPHPDTLAHQQRAQHHFDLRSRSTRARRICLQVNSVGQYKVTKLHVQQHVTFYIQQVTATISTL